MASDIVTEAAVFAFISVSTPLPHLFKVLLIFRVGRLAKPCVQMLVWEDLCRSGHVACREQKAIKLLIEVIKRNDSLVDLECDVFLLSLRELCWPLSSFFKALVKAPALPSPLRPYLHFSSSLSMTSDIVTEAAVSRGRGFQSVSPTIGKKLKAWAYVDTISDMHQLDIFIGALVNLTLSTPPPPVSAAVYSTGTAWRESDLPGL
ncbi:hypothetical protein BaRGS_00011430 [Batillaria attramentaria]|uniref:Uncharacterized protein n=1 Tax=Batillaria attramentaria TaxID=370345 RepID=A0ABD0LDZ9_9CAEN